MNTPDITSGSAVNSGLGQGQGFSNIMQLLQQLMAMKSASNKAPDKLFGANKLAVPANWNGSIFTDNQGIASMGMPRGF